MPFLDSNSNAFDQRGVATDQGRIIASYGKKSILQVIQDGSVVLGAGAFLNTGTNTQLTTTSGSITITNNTQGIDSATLNTILAAQSQGPPPPSADLDRVEDPEAGAKDKAGEGKSFGQRIAESITGVFKDTGEEADALRKRVLWAGGALVLAVAFLFWARKR